MLEVFSKRLFHAIQYDGDIDKVKEFIPGAVRKLTQDSFDVFDCQGGFFCVRMNDFIVVPAWEHKSSEVKVYSPESFEAYFTNDVLFGDLDKTQEIKV